jgi:two-component system cell cycle response regulator
VNNKKEKPQGRVLLIEDESQIQKLIKDALTLDGHKVQTAGSGKEALDLIPKFIPHLIMLDFNLPDMNGIQILEKIRELPSYISVIFVTAQNSMRDVVAGLDAGADDYVSKPFILGDLLARVRSQLRIKHLTDELHFANQKLKALVDIDDLTGLFNMRSAYKRIDHELEQCAKHNTSLGIIMMDLDHFKRVNDDHDHLFGSFVLSQVGAIIKDNIRFIDFGIRYGGDEFMIIITEASEQIMETICERLRSKIEATHFKSGLDEMRLTSSLGYSLSKPGERTPSKAVVRAADKALYQSKEQGRNRIFGYLQKKNPEVFTD